MLKGLFYNGLRIPNGRSTGSMVECPVGPHMSIEVLVVSGLPGLSKTGNNSNKGV